MGKRIIYLTIVFLVIFSGQNFGQTRFRSGIFLHHSTGRNIWGPNGSSTSVPDEITTYNTNHGYTGSEECSLNEQWFPSVHGDNEWSTWHHLFDSDYTDEDVWPIINANQIIVIKSCFPSSAMSGIGSPSDTVAYTTKSVYNYKWHWRHILRIMENHPEHFFVIWTNAPLVAASTDDNEAYWANEFCTWAKDTLAEGLDPEYGAFPKNVYVFDFFHKLAGTDYKLKPEYAVGTTDSHPNSAATELVAPQFVREVFDAAIDYENYYNGILQSPVLSSPANNATDVALDATLSWGSVGGATSYHLEVSTESDFGTTVVNKTVATNSYTFTGGELSNDTKYYWRVSSVNAGGESSWSSVWNFTTIPAIPAAPTLSSPANNATDVALDITLNWSSVSGATSYHVEVSMVSDFGTTVVDKTVTTNSYTFGSSELSNDTKYYWRVSSVNSGGESGWSSVWSFTTIPAIPLSPTLSSPANNATDVALNVTLNWGSVSGATSYHVEVSTASDFGITIVDKTVTTNSYTFASGELSNSTEYYWRVSSVNPGGESGWSSVWNFTTIPAIPASPTLSSPANNTTDVSLDVTLNWGSVSGATSYHVEVSTASDFSTTVVDKTVTTNSYTFASGELSNDTKYYWRVSSVNSGGESGCSSVWNFTTIPAIPASPTLSSPANNATDVALDVTMNWGSVSGATSYHVEVSMVSDFGTTVVDKTVTTNSYTFAGGELRNDTKYYWRVSSVNSGGESGWSSAWNFTTIPAIPASPTLSSPSDNATDVALDVTLNWGSVSGATSYHVEVSMVSDFGTTVVDKTVTTNSYTFASGELSNETKYYWCVSSVNSGGESGWSSVWNFTTIPAIPASPTLSSPANNATDVALDVTLNWGSVSGATSYHVEVSTASDFGTTVVDKTVTTNSYTFASGELSNDIKYYWRVSSVNSGGESGWSSVWGFTTIPAIPASPTLSSPAKDATDVPLDVTLTWSSVSGATSYHVEVSAVSDFGTTVIEKTVEKNAYSIEEEILFGDTVYYWRVRASNAAGTSDWSEVWNFRTISVTGIQNIGHLIEFKIYPNPSAGRFSIESSDLKNQSVFITIFDNGGHIIRILREDNVDRRMDIDLEGVDPGIYHILIQNSVISGRKTIVIY